MIGAGSPAWAAPAVLLVAAIAALLVWGYRRAPVRAAAGLKLLGVALLAACLVEPTFTTRHARPGANLFVVLADNGAGLRLADRGRSQSRGAELRAAIAPDRPWQARLSESFQVRRYVFDDRLRRSDAFAELAFDGPASHLGAALAALADRFQGTPLAGILVLSDGNATDLGDGPFQGAGLPPVYPVVIGGRAPTADVAVGHVTVTQTAFEDAPVTVEATIDAAGQAGATLLAELVEEGGRVAGTQSLAVSREDETLTARFRLRPERPGVAFYRVRVAVQGGAKEATDANNARLILIDRPKGPYRVLYVGGRPNWEYKFLRRAVDEDPQVELVGLLRIAHREPKFVWRGRGGETSNPLFRGFGRDDETARYDEPVLIRLATRDGQELRDGFPHAAEELFGYHALVFDDIEAGFFTADQRALIERFVADRGGGFLMLGGQESFGRGGYDRTPVAQLLPVYLDGAAAPPPPPWRLELTREGWLEPWVRLRDTEEAERARLALVPAFKTLSRVGAAKPGAVVLARIAGPDGGYPALVTHRYGSGRATALALGDLWRWGLGRPEQQADLARFWRQAVRHLVSDVPERVSVRAERRPGEAGHAVALRALARDAGFHPADDVEVTFEVTGPDGERTALAAEPGGGEPGAYEAIHFPRRTGGYRVRARVTGPDGAPAGEAEAGFVLDLEAEEHRSIRANPALLEAIARRTGGHLVPVDGLDRFVAELGARPAPVSDTRTRPLWDSWLVFAAALLCLGGEWWLRRTRGMA